MSRRLPEGYDRGVKPDFDQLARELVRHWRGDRTQLQASTDLGFESNVLSSWETGRTQPAAHLGLRLARQAGRDLRPLAQWVGADWIERVPFDSREGVALFLNDLIGGLPLRVVTQQSGFSRHALGRYLNAQAQPSLSAFLRLVDLSGRLMLALSILSDPTQLPSASSIWNSREAHARVYVDAPLAGQVHLALSLDAYRALPEHRPGWLASLLSISLEEERRCLELLVDLGLAERGATHFVARAETVQFDLQESPQEVICRQQAWANRRFWEGVRVKRQVLSALVSEAEARRVERVLVQAAEEVRRITTTSEAAERMVFVSVAMNRYEPPQ